MFFQVLIPSIPTSQILIIRSHEKLTYKKLIQQNSMKPLIQLTPQEGAPLTESRLLDLLYIVILRGLMHP